ncbi:head-to-tail stopper [Microbacterium phage Zeta1847]|uniref:Head-to-tail stopper n=1 Tax=Microbacterium phage Zeta1847 TaxID=2201444 RepID=A0A2Z4Q9A4_9CAUD|nr:head closure Hc1 [Microbacterium phage Zeta1847]AWY06642.1 head-to-tail stopper [Microbacterium phage Zeta1847]
MLTTLRSPDLVHRLRPGTRVDGVGDTVRDWRTPERVRIPNATLEPVTSTATDGSVLIIESQRRLLIVGTFDLKATDRVEADGEVWRVDGVPAVRRGLITGTHTAVKLERIEAR